MASNNIFFSDNAVVPTDTVEDIIGSPSNVQAISPNACYIYPNPATNPLTAKTSPNAFNSLTINNTIGQIMMQQEINGTQTAVNINTLPPGLYCITLKGDNGTKVEKFVKIKPYQYIKNI